MRKQLTVLGLAMAFVLSCSSDNDKDDNRSSPNGNNSNSQLYNCQLLTGACIKTITVSDCSLAGGYVVDFCQGQNSSSSKSSSSSVAVSSSSSVPIQSSVVYGPDVEYEGEIYKTVVIGTQTWFKRNLNYNASGSKCGNDSILSDTNTTTCDTYGRLYDWSTAMALPSSCNSTFCSGQINAKHQGICPSSWHIPKKEDWEALTAYIEGNKGCSNCDAKHLKTSEWRGLDSYGFSALPGGYGNFHGDWWSANEYVSNDAYLRDMYDLDTRAVWRNYDKSNLYSVRCLKD